MKKLLPALFIATVTAMTAILPTGALAATTTGQFTGANNHVTTGGVTVVKTADGGAVVILDSDFNLDGAPDPHVGFGRDGTFDVATDLGKLAAATGLQVFVVPASVDVDDYNEIYIWCLEFSVSLGAASLN